MKRLRFRQRAAWICLFAGVLTLPQAPAFGAWMGSRPARAESAEAARQDLARALAVERLIALNVDADIAELLVDAVLEDGPAGPGDLDALEARASGLAADLSARGHDPAATAARIAGGLGLLDAASRREALLQLGCSPREVDALAAQLTPDELRSLFARGAVPFDHAGRVVGLNLKGILILLLPILVALLVALLAGQSAGSIALGALAVGVLFVLLVEPEIIFGERAGAGR